MRIADVFGKGTLPVSYEIFPPKGELAADEARNVISQLAELDPSFVSVTYSAGGSGNSGATADVAEMAQNEFGLTMMAHLTCLGATRDFIEGTLSNLKAKGIENVLALRGDVVPGREAIDYRYARDLIPEVAEAGFCVGAAAYPEGHVHCLDLKADVEHLKQKQDAGASFFVTQLFFDNNFAYRFLDAARDAGVTAPISFGVMPFLSKKQVQRMVFMCGVSLPSRIAKFLNIYEDDPASLRKAGVEYACEQLVDLAEHGVDGVHVYCMNKPVVARAAADALASHR